MALVVGSSLRHAVYAKAVGIEAYEVHLAWDRLQELLLTLPLLVLVVQSVLMFVTLHDDHAVLSLHHEVHSDKALGALVKPNHDLASEINALSLQVAFYAFLMNLDPLAPTTLLMNVASATVTETSTAQLAD